MDTNSTPVSASRWWRWFDPRGKSSGSFGFMVNRIAGLGLSLYLFMHLVMLSKLAAGQASFDAFIELAHHPIIVAGEFLVVFAVLLHGINGLRIAATSFGIGSGAQKSILFLGLGISLIGAVIFAIKMFGG